MPRMSFDGSVFAHEMSYRTTLYLMTDLVRFLFCTLVLDYLLSLNLT